MGSRSSKEENLNKLGQYEKAMVQLNQLTEKLATAKTVGGDGEEITTVKAAINKSAAIASASKKASIDASRSFAPLEKSRLRAPKTRYSNPLTSSLPGMSKAKRATKDPVAVTTAAGSTPADVGPMDLKAEMKELEKRLTELKGAMVITDMKEQAEAEAVGGEDPDYPDLPTFRYKSSWRWGGSRLS